jgi:hypothetical protein
MVRLRARDAATFGHEIGRALSHGQIIGRAEPLPKMFAFSRQVKRAVGPVHGDLGDVALNAHLDTTQRLADTAINARRTAANLTRNQATAARYLAQLRDLRIRHSRGKRPQPLGPGRACRCILDLSACLERFTHTLTSPATSNPAPTTA